MDVISTIKVRNADGSYSSSMPIGTVSDYITVAADGSSLSSILGNVDLNRYGSIQSQINALGGGSGVADGVVYVGDNPEDTDDVPIEKINGISFDAKSDVLKAYWQADGEYKEAQLAPPIGGEFGAINTTTDSNIITSFEGNIILTVSGACEQNILEGLSLYQFENYSATQNGVTMTIKDNVLSWSGTPTIITNGKVIFEDYLDEIDLSILTNNYYIYSKGASFGFDVYDLNGSILKQNADKYYYDNTTVGKIIPHIRKEYWNDFTSGNSLIMLCQSPEDTYASSFLSEPYTGGIPAPNPSYPQAINFSSVSDITLENENGNSVINFGENILLYSTGKVADIINSTSIVRKVALITLTGAEAIGGDAVSGYFIYTPSILGKANSINILSDYYRNVNRNLSETDYNIFIDANGDIRIQHSGFTSIEEYKTWLASNNVTIVYERAEAEVVALSSKVSATLKNLKIYSGETTITTNSETIQPIVKIEYPTSTAGKYILELLARVTELEAKIN